MYESSLDADIREVRARLDRAEQDAEAAAEAWGEERSEEAWYEYGRRCQEVDRAWEDLEDLIDQVHQALRDRRFA